MLTWNLIILLFSSNQGCFAIPCCEKSKRNQRKHQEQCILIIRIETTHWRVSGYLVLAESQLVSWGWSDCLLPAGSGFLAASLSAACSQRVQWSWRCWQPGRPEPLGYWSGSLSPGLWTYSPTKGKKRERYIKNQWKSHPFLLLYYADSDIGEVWCSEWSIYDFQYFIYASNLLFQQCNTSFDFAHCRQQRVYLPPQCLKCCWLPISSGRTEASCHLLWLFCEQPSSFCVPSPTEYNT